MQVEFNEERKELQIEFDKTEEDEQIHRDLLTLAKEKGITLEQCINQVLEDAMQNEEFMDEIAEKIKSETKESE